MAADADQEKLCRRWPFQMVFPPGTFIENTSWRCRFVCHGARLLFYFEKSTI
jgi:hypothetical protein